MATAALSTRAALSAGAAAAAPAGHSARLASSRAAVFSGARLETRGAGPACASRAMCAVVQASGEVRGPQNLKSVGLLGHKAGMTQIFDAVGNVIPVTVIAIGDGNIVTQVKTPETDGYTSVQVGFGLVKDTKIPQPEVGHLKKAEAPPMRHLVEFRVKDVAEFKPGQQLDAGTVFAAGDKVDVSGISIGKGFQGTIKRHNFHRGFMTHGSKSHRAPGSISSGTTPGRIYPGKRMAGHMGSVRVTVRGLEVVRVDAENKCIIVKGAVPGKPGNFLRVTPTKQIGNKVKVVQAVPEKKSVNPAKANKK